MRLSKCPRCKRTGKSIHTGRHVDTFRCEDCKKKFYVPQDHDEPISWLEYILVETLRFSESIIIG